MKRKALLLTIATLTASLSCGTISKAQDPAFRPKPTQQILVFGDSLSDTGNLYSLTSKQQPPSPPYFEGRFSSGPVWVEDVAKTLGIQLINSTTLVNQDLLPTSANQNLLPTPAPSINFAVGGATSGDRNIGSSLLPGLTQELELLQDVETSPRSLYTLWIGGNDYLGLQQFAASRRRIRLDVVPVMKNIENALVTLAKNNPRIILVANLPDLGKTPFAKQNNSQTTLSQLAASHNRLLGLVLHRLQLRFPKTQFVLLDVDSLFRKVTQNPNRYQLTNVIEPCLDPRSQPLKLCSNPDAYLFWDDIHPTAAAHRLIAQEALRLLRRYSITQIDNSEIHLAHQP